MTRTKTRTKTAATIVACARKGHQWRPAPPLVCRRCGLALTTKSLHWQHRQLRSPWDHD